MASKSHSEKPEKEGEEGESSYEESEILAGAQLKKSESRIMREQATRASINSTRELVAAYNQVGSEDESKALHQWLQQYSPYLDTDFAKHAEGGIFEEMSCLAIIKPHCEKDKELIRKMIRFLGQQVTDDSLDQRKIAAALAEALQAVNESVFGNDPTALLNVSNALLSKLDADRTVFIQATHDTNSITLFALHQVLLIVQRMTASTANFSDKQQWFQTFRAKLDSIAACQTHFPSYFQVKMVEQCLEHLVIVSPSGIEDLPRRMVSIMSGCCYLYSGVRKLLTADIDLDSLTKGCERLKEAVADRGHHREHQREWYVQYLKLNSAALLSSESTDFDSDFMPCLVEAMEAQGIFSSLEDANLLRFGIVTQLAYATLHGKSPDFCMCAMTELIYLATRYATYEGWDNEPAIIDAILTALQDAYSVSSLQEMAETGVLCMKSSDSHAVRERVEEWLQGRTIEDTLREHVRASEEPTECCYLFKIVRKKLGLYSHQEKLDMVEELKSVYTSSDFSEISGILKEQVKKHVSKLNFHILYDKGDLIEDANSRIGSSSKQNQMEDNIKRAQQARESVALEDLFGGQYIKFNGPTKVPSKVLLYGNPGTGKTTIGKRIVNDWARGFWGLQFRVLYLLYIRDLNKKKYEKSGNIRKHPTLECAIANFLFSAKQEDKEFVVLTKYIKDDLECTTTLLVLDGLDESDDIGYEMLRQALCKQCSLLLLTRPYNLHEIRKRVQVEVECVGLNDEQLTEFIKSELPNENATALMEYLKRSPRMWTLAHIPVTANVLCLVWKEREGQHASKEALDATIFQLYQTMVNFMWDIFQKKFPEKQLSKEDAYLSLQEIAFYSLWNGEIQISVTLIQEHCLQHVSDELLKHCGFFLLDQEGTFFQFIHLTFQEFFAGLALSNMLFDSNESRKKEAEKFILHNKFKDQFAITMTFATQSMCFKHAFDGFKRFIDIATCNEDGKAKKKIILIKLRILDALVCSRKREEDIDLLDNSIIIDIITEAVNVFHDIRCIEHDFLFFGASEMLIREVEWIPRTVRSFPKLWIALYEGYRSKSLKCAKTMFTVATRIARQCASQSHELMERIASESNMGDHKNNVVCILCDLAREIPSQSDTIIKLAQASSIDNDWKVRLCLTTHLSQLAKEMPKEVDAFISLARSLSEDDDEDVKEIAIRELKSNTMQFKK